MYTLGRFVADLQIMYLHIHSNLSVIRYTFAVSPVDDVSSTVTYVRQRQKRKRPAVSSLS